MHSVAITCLSARAAGLQYVFMPTWFISTPNLTGALTGKPASSRLYTVIRQSKSERPHKSVQLCVWLVWKPNQHEKTDHSPRITPRVRPCWCLPDLWPSPPIKYRKLRKPTEKTIYHVGWWPWMACRGFPMELTPRGWPWCIVNILEECNTVEPRQCGHLRAGQKVSTIARCPH